MSEILQAAVGAAEKAFLMVFPLCGTQDAVRAAAEPHIRAAERERVAALADHHEARRACLECGNYIHTAAGPCCPKSFWFADLIREDGDAA